MADNPGGYSSGIYGPGNGPPEPKQEVQPGNDPSYLSAAYMAMSEAWQPVKCCAAGTQYFRENASTFLPQEPREDHDAWLRRVSHAVLPPYLTRMADQAAGLILRKPITLQPKEGDGDVDPFWDDFVADVDGFGTSIEAFAKRLVTESILTGHAATLVDFPATEPAPNLAIERQLGLRPYFLGPIAAADILGWRAGDDSPIAPITQVRINRYVTEPVGPFGEKVVREILVLSPGAWETYRKGDGGWSKHSEGTTSLAGIPLCVTYSAKVAELISKPPLLPIAQLNILTAQRLADLQHALHVAALPILTISGWDDTDSTIGLSANSAIVLPPDGSAQYVEPASSAFQSQQDFISHLEEQMSNLGLSTLFAQKNAAETADSKRMSRTDSDSLLALISKDLERCLQDAIDLAGQFLNKDAPKVVLDRDLDLQSLSGDQVNQYQQLWMNGAITHETLLSMLKKGEILPDVDIEEEVEAVSQEKLQSMDIALAGSEPVEQSPSDSPPDKPDEDEGESEARKEVVRRLQKLALRNGNNKEEAN
jgi:hypothetical protein